LGSTKYLNRIRHCAATPDFEQSTLEIPPCHDEGF